MSYMWVFSCGQVGSPICKAAVSLTGIRCYGFVFHTLMQMCKWYLIYLYNRKVNGASPSIKTAVLCLGCKDKFIHRKQDNIQNIKKAETPESSSLWKPSYSCGHVCELGFGGWGVGRMCCELNVTSCSTWAWGSFHGRGSRVHPALITILLENTITWMFLDFFQTGLLVMVIDLCPC